MRPGLLPGIRCRSLLLALLLSSPLHAGFVERGDSNNDGVVDLSDAIVLFDWLLNGSGQSICLSASDTNVDGGIDLSDGIFLLYSMFVSGEEPVAYHPGLEPGCYSREGTFALRNETALVLSPISAVVVWETAEPSDSRVHYRASSDETERVVVVDEEVYHHQVLLTGLRPDTTYSYAVSSQAAGGALSGLQGRRFQTTPVSVPDITSSHPRIFFNSRDIPKLRARVQEGGTHQAHWEALLSWCGAKASLPNEEIYASAHFLQYVRALSFAGLIGDSVTFRKKARELVVYHLDSSDPIDLRDSTEALAYVYDWLYDYIPSDQRDRIGAALLRRCVDLQYQIQNHEFVTGMSHGDNKSLFLGSLALYGDAPDAADLLQRAVNYFDFGYLANWRRFASQDGGSSKGWWYSTWAVMFELEFLAAWRSATGEDRFPREKVWCESLLHWFLFGWRGDDSFLRAGDTWVREGMHYLNRNFATLVAAEYGNSQAQWLAAKAQAVGTLWAPTAVYDILWSDPQVESAPPVGDTSRWFRNAGVVVCRESWDPDATLVSFQSAESYTLGHSHLDSCSFTVFHRGDLALDSGIYDDYSSEHHDNYYSRTIAHNTLTVHDPNELFVKFGKTFANDGGQRWLRPGEDAVASWPARPEDTVDRSRGFRLGGMIHYEDESDYTYAVGDGGPAYSPAKVKKFLRHFLWLREVDGTSHPVVVLFDDVVSTRDSFQKRYLLHTKNKPEVDGRLVLVRDGDGALYHWTASPEAVDIRLVGGRDQEFLVDGVNYAPTRPPYGKEEPGAWRVEISPQVQRRSDRLLHVLYPVDADAPPPPEPAGFVADTFHGVRVGQWVLVFGTGATLTTLQYVCGLPQSRHLVGGAVPFATYEVRVDGIPIGTSKASFAGLLRFNVRRPGTVRIVAKS